MHGLSSLQARHANCVWRRAKERGDHAGRGTARRVRRCRWQAVCRTRAGKIMDQALEEAGIDRCEAYVTNAVKHFKWEPRGKRRIHQKPNAREIAACRPWLEAELRIVKPNLVVAMGATAAQAVFGPGFRVTRERGKVLSSKLAPRVL